MPMSPTRRPRAACRLTVLTITTILAGGLTAGPAEAAFSIAAPTTASLGSIQAGSGLISARLGTVTVSADTNGGSWIASISATTCTTGTGLSYQRIGASALQYRSGPATAVTGQMTVANPGQPSTSYVTLGATRLSFSGSANRGGTSSVSWNPTLAIALPTNIVVGTYRCTLTYSVA